MFNRPMFTGPQVSPVNNIPTKVEVTVPPVSHTSGLPCTFLGGMEAAKNGCLDGALSKTPVAGCITGAFQNTAKHTAGCVDVKSVPNLIARR